MLARRLNRRPSPADNRRVPRSPRNLRANVVLLGARGRARVRVDHVPPEARRLVRQMALLLLAAVPSAAIAEDAGGPRRLAAVAEARIR